MANLRKIRIGTDITIALSVNVSGQPVTWKDGDIRHVYAFSDVQGQPVAEMAHQADGQTLRCTYAAKDQNYTGAFRVIVEFASGEAFSSSLDVPAFEIVRTTEEADADTGEVVLDIDGTMRFYSLSEAFAKLEAATKAATDAAAAADKSAGNADAKAKAANDAAEKANAAAQAAGTTNTGIAKAEEQRINAENARKEAELARSKAETARASAEDKRAGSEAKRAEAEVQRAADEVSRKTAETGRENAESARVTAERARVNAEATRAANEDQRKKNESARTSDESGRVEAEKARVAAESARVAEFSRLKTESETATDNATKAATRANDAADNAANDIEALKTGRTTDNRVLAEAIVSLAARIDALERGKPYLGNATAGVIDVNEITRARYPLVMVAHGVPAEANVPDNLPAGLPWDGIPAFVGQQYVNLDAPSGGFYYATGIEKVSDWKQA